MDSDDWDRVLVINSEIDTHITQSHSLDENNAKVTTENERAARRIRAFAWSQHLDLPVLANDKKRMETTLLSKYYRTSLLAVSNDDCEIYVLSIASKFGQEKDPLAFSWKAYVVAKIQLNNLQRFTAAPLGSDFYHLNYAQGLSLSPWTTTASGVHVAGLACIYNGGVRVYALQVSDGIDFPEAPIKVETQTSLSQEPPSRKDARTDFIKFSRLLHNNQLALIYSNIYALHVRYLSIEQIVSPSESYYQSLDSKLGLNGSEFPFDRDERLAGNIIRFNHLSQAKRSETGICEELRPFTQSSRVQTVTTSACETLSIRLGAEGDSQVAEALDWRAGLVASKDSFSNEHNLRGKVKVTIHGFSSLPIGGLKILVYTLHPADRPEYVAPRNEGAILAVTANDVCLTQDLPAQLSKSSFFDPGSCSEIALLTLNMLHCPQDDDPTESVKVLERAKESLLNSRAILRKQSSTTAPTVDGKLIQTVQTLSILERVKVDMDDDFDLRSSSCDPEDADMTYEKDSKELALAVVVKLILSLSRVKVPRSSLNRQTLYNAAWVGAFGVPGQLQPGLCLKEAKGAFDWLAENTSTEFHLEKKEAQNLLDGQHHDISGQNGNRKGQETCDVCDGKIDFVDIEEARCVNGHEFVRCKVSLLAIQSPGISKYCRICGMECLNESAIGSDEVETGGTPLGAPRSQLVLVAGKPRDEWSQQTGWAVVRENEATSTELEDSPSILQALFAILDKCISCGSRFVG
ncbi:MAG: hypothetical protein M1814_001107 [Vezdaea aestivalis]|nr:MAG: hypothetical protein M1814_001107 [Vezdaea aestivalis]